MKRVEYVADFETSTPEFYEIDKIARVWASCAVTVEATPQVKHLSNNIDDFMKWALKDCIIYFHNLAFDGKYILYWLLTHGYTYSEEAKPKTFNALITDMGVWYDLTITNDIHIYNGKKKYNKTIIRDSFKKLPFKVSEISEAFGISENKLHIVYEEYREVSHKLTPEEEEYVKADCVIVAKALHMQFEAGLNKMTVASDALHQFKNNPDYGIGSETYKFFFPENIGINHDEFVRTSYKGGFCFLNKRFINQRLHGISFDVNSLYPDVLYNCMLPFDYPLEFKGKYIPNEKYPLYVQRFSCWFDVKEGYLPTIQLKHTSNFAESEYIEHSKEIVTLTLCSPEMELFFKHYNVTNITYYGGYMYRGTNNIFKKYIDYWFNIKCTSTGAIKTRAKLMLNSLYGKFGSSPIHINKLPELDSEEILKFKRAPEKDDEFIKYIPVASFVTCYARVKTITSAQKYYNRFIYADTDSISLKGYEIPSDLPVDNKKLGYWKNEGIFTDSIFLKQKTYIKVKPNKEGVSEAHITCAGMPDTIKEKLLKEGEKIFDLFTYNHKFEGKLIPKTVKGGVILFKDSFTIKL